MPKIVKNALNPKILDALTAPGKYNDGGGLLLRIDRQGNKNWVQRVARDDGKETTKGLGKYPAVSLAEARRAAAKLKERLASNKPEFRVPTFAEAAERFAEGWTKGLKRQRNADEWIRTLCIHAYPKIGTTCRSMKSPQAMCWPC